MVHVITPSTTKRNDLMNSIEQDRRKIENYNAIAKLQLKANNKGEHQLDPSQKNKTFSKCEHPLLAKIKK